MDEIENQIKRILPLIDKNEVAAIVNRLVELGVSDESHLKLIEERDLIPVTKIIQARLLVRSWKNEVYTSPIASNENLEISCEKGVGENEKGCMSPKIPTSNLDWAYEFVVPWENMPKGLMKSLKENLRPSPSLRRQMVRVVTNSIREYCEKPGKKALSIIARKIVKEYSSSLADTLCGEIVGEGHSSLLKQMEVRFDNMNRENPFNVMKRTLKQENESNLNGDNKKKKVILSDSYGCINWQPSSLPVHETDETQQSKKAIMLEMSVSNPKHMDIHLMKKLLQETYYTLRKDINSGNNIIYLKKEWPLLFSKEGFFNHFEILVGINIMEKINDSLSVKGFRIIAFLKSVSSGKKKMEQWLEGLNMSYDPKLLCALLCLLMVYFEENIGELFIAVDVTVTSDEISEMQLPFTPCLLCHGEDIISATSFTLIIDKEVAIDHLKIFTEALAVLFSAYFCFNIHYPKSACITLEFIQRCFLGINPNKGSKVDPEKRKKEHINSKLLSMINKISCFEWNC